MRAALMYEAGDVRIADVADPVLEESTDAFVRVATSCICGSDLHPCRSMSASDGPRMGHEFSGVVEEIGSEVRSVQPGDLVVVQFLGPTGPASSVWRLLGPQRDGRRAE